MGILIFRKFIKFLTFLVSSGVFILLLSRLITTLYASPLIYSKNEVPSAPVAVVFGAGLRRDGTPTSVLRDRVDTAVQLYNSGKVDKLLLSGDSRFDGYNEPAAMKNYAVNLGVPEADIILDLAGQRTYDTCYRAAKIFGVEQAVLVTQGFHLPRALYTCRLLGLHAFGVTAEGYHYRRISVIIWNIRELLATFTALWDVHIIHPTPILEELKPTSPINTQ